MENVTIRILRLGHIVNPSCLGKRARNQTLNIKNIKQRKRCVRNSQLGSPDPKNSFIFNNDVSRHFDKKRRIQTKKGHRSRVQNMSLVNRSV